VIRSAFDFECEEEDGDEVRAGEICDACGPAWRGDRYGSSSGADERSRGPDSTGGPAKLETQTEDVLVDTRGNIYITDKQWGLFILRYTGEGEPRQTAK
jgi:hypothetical protein